MDILNSYPFVLKIDCEQYIKRVVPPNHSTNGRLEVDEHATKNDYLPDSGNPVRVGSEENAGAERTFPCCFTVPVDDHFAINKLESHLRYICRRSTSTNTYI